MNDSSRRSFLKGLIGAPVAVLAAGSVVANGAVFKEHEDSAILVPSRNLIAAPAGLDRRLATGFIPGYGHRLNYVCQPGNEVLLRPGETVVLTAYTNQTSDYAQLVQWNLVTDSGKAQADLVVREGLRV